MELEQRAAALKRWNETSRENTETAIANAMLEETPNSYSKFLEFNTWALVSCGAISSFVLVNIEKFAPYVGPKGIAWGMGCLAASFVLGLAAKVFGLKVAIAKDAGRATREEFDRHMQLFQEGEEQRIALAAQLGIPLEKGVRRDRILADFQAVLPLPMRVMVRRALKTEGKDIRYFNHYAIVKNFMWLGILTMLQLMSLGGFFLVQFYYVISVGKVFIE